MMSETEERATIARLEARLKAQQKTIEVLMDVEERRSAQGTSPLELLSRNISLERVVQQKTEVLQKQGEELQQALKELKSAQTRLLQGQKLESVGQLAAGIAHEINTPAQFIGSNICFLKDAFNDVMILVENLQRELASVSGGSPAAGVGRKVETLLEESDWGYLKSEIPKAILQSQEGISRVTTIVNAMKEFSHPGSKEKEYKDLNKIIETTVTIASNEWKYCAEVKLELDPDLPLVLCLADEIGQAILNILINACHAIADKNRGRSEKGLLTISSRRYPDHVEICIEDTGGGIPEDIRERVFDPFFTTKCIGKGTGQGLAISHDVIETKHDGHLSFVSEIGKGTIFTLQLPLG